MLRNKEMGEANPRLSVLFPIIIGGASAYLKQAWICVRLARLVETDALPTELYRCLIVGTRGLEPHSQDFPFRQSPGVRHNPSKLGFCSHLWRFQSCAYTMSAKCPFAEAERFELSEPFERLGPLAEGWFRPLTHASFLLTLQS